MGDCHFGYVTKLTKNKHWKELPGYCTPRGCTRINIFPEFGALTAILLSCDKLLCQLMINSCMQLWIHVYGVVCGILLGPICVIRKLRQITSDVLHLPLDEKDNGCWNDLDAKFRKLKMIIWTTDFDRLVAWYIMIAVTLTPSGLPSTNEPQ